MAIIITRQLRSLLLPQKMVFLYASLTCRKWVSAFSSLFLSGCNSSESLRYAFLMSADEASCKNTKQTLSEMNSQNLVKIWKDSQPSAGTRGNVIWAFLLNSRDIQQPWPTWLIDPSVKLLSVPCAHYKMIVFARNFQTLASLKLVNKSSVAIRRSKGKLKLMHPCILINVPFHSLLCSFVYILDLDLYYIYNSINFVSPWL